MGDVQIRGLSEPQWPVLTPDAAVRGLSARNTCAAGSRQKAKAPRARRRGA